MGAEVVFWQFYVLHLPQWLLERIKFRVKAGVGRRGRCLFVSAGQLSGGQLA